jgi:hypothetical protein
MAHLALHFPVVKRKTDSSLRFEERELKELPDRFVFMIEILDHFSIFVKKITGGHKIYKIR